MPVLHAFDLLEGKSAPREARLVTTFGEDRTLRSWVRGRLVDPEADEIQIEAESAEWRDVRDELSTGSLFGSGGLRTVVLRDADPLVKKYRAELETYAARPSSAAVLVLDVQSWPGNTRLAKAVAADHLAIECAVPKVRGGRSGRADLGRLRAFLQAFIAERHACQLQTGAADQLIDLLGTDVGMLDTELAKLAVSAPPGEAIDEPLVREIVGGWRGKTVWEIIDAAAAGQAAEALRQLDRMLATGERPIALLPQIAWSLRRLGLATAAVDLAEARGRRIAIKDALQQAGVRANSFELKKAEQQLRQLGRQRGRRILPWLLEADLRLKGTHSTDDRGRWVLEELFLKLARQDA